jgi:hypothetical protein
MVCGADIAYVNNTFHVNIIFYVFFVHGMESSGGASLGNLSLGKPVTWQALQRHFNLFIVTL